MTPESAISFSSPPDARPEPAVLPLDEGLLDDGVLEDGLLDGGVASLLGEPDMRSDAPLNFAFFSTKLPPALLELALDGLLLDGSLLDAPPARCRQPLALIMPGDVLDGDCGAEVVGDGGFGVVGDCGFGVVGVGLCAASVPHSATAVPSVTAHRHSCVFFMAHSLSCARSAVYTLGNTLGSHPTSRFRCKARATRTSWPAPC